MKTEARPGVCRPYPTSQRVHLRPHARLCARQGVKTTSRERSADRPRFLVRVT
nr:MAG TPA: hypothetical protein [Caudoviricetes sp.]